MKMRVKDFIPPIVARWGTRLQTSPYGWSGDFASWDEASQQCEGYDTTQIINKVATSLQKVKEGSAVYERDSVLFDEIHYSWPLLAGLLWTAAASRGRLHVLDFGGSLGSTYFQNRKFLSSLEDLSWSVVEQESFVQAGKARMEDQRLRFYADIQTCTKEQHPNVFLFSCVLQYLQSPYDLLKSALEHNPDMVIVDNMPFTSGKQRLTIQRVPPQIYHASYPCWILNKQEFMSAFLPTFELVENFQSPLYIPLDGDNVPYEGFIFKRTKTI